MFVFDFGHYQEGEGEMRCFCCLIDRRSTDGYHDKDGCFIYMRKSLDSVSELERYIGMKVDVKGCVYEWDGNKWNEINEHQNP